MASPVQNNQSSQLLVGIDVGSTTAKIAVMDAASHEMLMRRYVRHHAQQANCLKSLLAELDQRFEGIPMRAALCGSGGAALAEALDLPYVQEVVANSLAVGANYPTARTAIELGGQDAKMIFFKFDNEANCLSVADMRMNLRFTLSPSRPSAAWLRAWKSRLLLYSKAGPSPSTRA